MDIIIPTSIGVDNIVPPRCRSPRYAEVRLDVPCRIAELDSRQLHLAAEVTQPRRDQAETTLLYHAADFGFLEPTALMPEAIPRTLAPPPAPSALPPDSVRGQGHQALDAARITIQNKAERYLIAGNRVYQRVPEPCYFLRYTPSFNYTALDLEIRSIPEFPGEDFGLHTPSGNMRPHGHFYNANDRSHAEAAIATVQAALPHSLSVDAKNRIAIHIPHLFTFDAARWHTACEQREATQAITDLLSSLNDIRTRDAEFIPLYPERAELIQRISRALQDVLNTI